MTLTGTASRPAQVGPYDEQKYRGPIGLVIAAWVSLVVPVVLGLGLRSYGWFDLSWFSLRPVIALVASPGALFGSGYYDDGYFDSIPLVLHSALGGIALALIVGAVISLARWNLAQAGLAMLGLVLTITVTIVWSAGGPVNLVQYFRPLTALVASVVIAGVGFALVLVEGKFRNETGLSPATARSIWRSEQNLQLANSALAHAGLAYADPQAALTAAYADASSGLAASPVPASPNAGVIESDPLPPGMVLPPPAGLNPEYATFGRRLAGRLIDWVFCFVVFVPVVAASAAGVAAAMGADPAATALVVVLFEFGVWELAYYVVGVSHGQTIGARMVGIRICREDGSRVRLGLSLWRTIVTPLSGLALGIGWLAPLWAPKRQTWQDSIANTIVIRDTTAKLAKAAVIWTLIWSVVTGVLFGAGVAWVFNEMEKDGYYVDYDYGGYDDNDYYVGTEDYGYDEWGD